ncbi:hypothetical protein [uncultured Campylobacter sp.]|uniref:hypothetical protein n=1 Tax=uncultured Campylobacter sp. TaxID=218934 RepID=UPI002628207C|nr:hypothetical protein [uncultured Campylobacter sp.]
MQVRHPAMIAWRLYAILSVLSVHDDTRSRVSLIGKLGRSSRYKILMRRARHSKI